jgi:hypothetical protein
MNASPASSADEVTLGSYVRYFAAIWWLGFKLTARIAGGGILALLMLAFASLIVSIPVWLLPLGEEAKQATWWALFGGVMVPLAIYVGGSSAGFCPRITAEQFPTPVGEQEKSVSD